MTNARLILIALMSVLPAAAAAHGSDPALHVGSSYKECYVKFAPELTQAAYARFVREFGSASAFNLLAPPQTLGRGHFALGIEQVSFTVEEHSDAWNDTFEHPNAEHDLGARQTFPSVRVRVGVADRVDVGAFFTRNPLSNYGWLGLEGKYGLWRQNEKQPLDVAIRGAWTRTLYVDDMTMNAGTLDLVAGHRFGAPFTAYAAMGNDVIVARETSPVVTLSTEVQSVPHLIGGFEFRYWHVLLGGEARVSAVNSAKLQVAMGF